MLQIYYYKDTGCLKLILKTKPVRSTSGCFLLCFASGSYFKHKKALVHTAWFLLMAAGINGRATDLLAFKCITHQVTFCESECDSPKESDLFPKLKRLNALLFRALLHSQTLQLF